MCGHMCCTCPACAQASTRVLALAAYCLVAAALPAVAASCCCQLLLCQLLLPLASREVERCSSGAHTSRPLGPPCASLLPPPLQAAIDNLEWGANYLMACHPQNNTYIAMIGNETDHQYWGRCASGSSLGG